jgi:hypothetical protein
LGERVARPLAGPIADGAPALAMPPLRAPSIAQSRLARLLLLVRQRTATPIDPRQENAVTYTYYDYLDLSPAATPVQIQSSYVALLERFGYGTTEAGQDMSGLLREIHSAYEVLSNAEARHRYDSDLAQEAAMADAELKASLDQQATVSHRHVQNPPAARRNALVAVAA